MAASTIRVGVIGCGFYAQNHLHAWQDLAGEGAALTAVCDIDPAKAEAAGRKFGVPFYSDAAALLDGERLDAVDIVTQQDTHRALCELTLSRGLATIVQKPFAPSWEDCIAIVETAHRAGVWLAVHENFRFQTPMRHVRRVIDSGAIGVPNWARVNFRTGYDVYGGQPYLYDEEHLAIADVGVHVLDLARFFMGEVTRISCETQRRNPKPKGEDTATMLLRHESGGVSIVECTYDARREPDAFPETLVEIEGPRGSIIVDAGCRMTVTSDGAAREQDISAPLLPWTSHPWHVSQEGAIGACRHFLDCLKRGVPAETSGEDNLKSYALVDAAYRAAAEHRAIAPASWRASGVSPRSGGSAMNADQRADAAFAITVGFELVEGAFGEFHRLVNENAALSVGLEPDCLRFDVLTPVDALGSTHVFLYEIYKDRAAFDMHLASAHFRNFDERTRALVLSKTVLAYAVRENAKPVGALT